MNRTNSHIESIDCFRGAAILGVVLFHLLYSSAINVSSCYENYPMLHGLLDGLSDIVNLGGLGVAVFFVVSGFCIHLSYLRAKKAGLLPFFARRFFRIYPAYIFSLLFVIFIIPNSRWVGNWQALSANWIDLILHLFLANNFLPQTLWSINGIYWSLAIEFQLYLLFPLLIFLTIRLGWRQTMIVTGVVELVSRVALIVLSHCMNDVYPPQWGGWMLLSPFGFWFSWSLGAMLADAFVKKQELPLRHGPLPLWIWPFLVLLVNSVPYLPAFSFPVAAMATARFLAYFLSRGTMPLSPSGPRKTGIHFLKFFGTISYSLYLLHLPVLKYFMLFTPRAHGHFYVHGLQIAYLGLALFVTVALSYLLYFFVETSGIALGKKVVDLIPEQRRSDATDLA